MQEPSSHQLGSQDDEIAQLRRENELLRAQLQEMKLTTESTEFHNDMHNGNGAACPQLARSWDGVGHGLTKEQISRYSRQIILPSFGVKAQAKLCNSSVLVIGAGGLGSPALLYLAAAGVGRIGIVDRDTVDLSNIHRQIIHTENRVGTHKAISAAEACKAINSSITIETHVHGFTPANAVQMVSAYDIVIDASDNAPTRYLISDACAATHRPLVSGAAIGTDGQLTVYCYGEDGPCYRCLFPVAPLPQSCARCVDAGVLGVVPGIIGTMQAVEAVKILAGLGEPMSRKLLVMDSLAGRFHTVKLRGRSETCVACGNAPEITAENLKEYDYQSFTGQAPNDSAPKPLKLLPEEQRITPKELHQRLQSHNIDSSIINVVQSFDNESSLPSNGATATSSSSRNCLLIDVRPLEQYNICHLPGSIHAPYSKFDTHIHSIKSRIQEQAQSSSEPEVYVVCRRGNDSQLAVVKLQEAGVGGCVDLIGGMEAWNREVDPEFPVY